MNKLSDLELEKRIAEIEGVTLGFDGVSQLDGMRNVNGSWEYYNPLEDKAMLLDLIFKHRVSIVMNGNGDNHAFFMDKDIDIYQPDVDKFPRAILEAIVEANNG